MNQRRFSIPNDIWKWNLKPQGFATLAYLCYLHIHCNKGASSSADEIASQLHMSKDMAAEQLSELNHRGLLDQHMVPVFKNTSKNFFSLPNELFFLNIGHGVITVYAYLLYCEDRRTHALPGGKGQVPQAGNRVYDPNQRPPLGRALLPEGRWKAHRSKRLRSYGGRM